METNTGKQLPSCKLTKLLLLPARSAAARRGRWRSLQACNISFEADEAPCIRDDNCKAGLRCSAGQCVAAAAKKLGAEERRQRSLQAAV